MFFYCQKKLPKKKKKDGYDIASWIHTQRVETRSTSSYVPGIYPEGITPQDRDGDDEQEEEEEYKYGDDDVLLCRPRWRVALGRFLASRTSPSFHNTAVVAGHCGCARRSEEERGRKDGRTGSG